MTATPHNGKEEDFQLFMALLDGDLTEHQFEHGRWSQPDVTALARKVEVVVSEDFVQRLPKGRPVAITVHCAGRAPLRDVQEVPMGDADRPMDDAAIEAKFRGLAEPALGAAGATRVLDVIARLDTLHDLRELTAAMTVPR